MIKLKKVVYLVFFSLCVASGSEAEDKPIEKPPTPTTTSQAPRTQTGSVNVAPDIGPVHIHLNLGIGGDKHKDKNKGGGKQ